MLCGVKSHVRVLGWPAKTGRAWLGVCRSSVRTLQSSCGVWEISTGSERLILDWCCR